MKTILATGAGSRIVSAALLLAVQRLIKSGESLRLILTDHPGAVRGLEKTVGAISEVVGSGTKIVVKPFDLTLGPPQAVYKKETIDYLVLGAAAGLTNSDEKAVEMINNTSQVSMARDILQSQACTAVFLNSTYGHNLELPMPHQAYATVAYPKNRAERELRVLGTKVKAGSAINFVVSSIVARTGASILLRHELKSEYDTIVNSLPGSREVSLEEVATATVKALSCPNGTTIFVPENGQELASLTMLDLSRS